MRISARTELLTGQVLRQDHNVNKTYTYSGSKLIQVESSARSAVQRTQRDNTGWRPPTRYEAAFDKVTPWNAGGSVEIWVWKDTANHSLGRLSTYTQTGDPSVNTAVTALRLSDIPVGVDRFPSWLVTRAENRALGDLKDMTVNYAIAIAESRKAAALVAQTANQLVTALRAARKGNMYAAAKALGVARPRAHRTRKPVYGYGAHARAETARRWLELNYGWMPLLMDIHGVVQDFEKGILREPRISVTKESKSKEIRNWVIPSPSQSRYLQIAKRTNEHVARVRLDYVLDTAAFQTLAQKGLTNPLLVAWELVPYSFVVDWFAPIGEWLNTLDAAGGLTFKGGSVTTFTRAKTEVTASFQSSSYWGGSATCRGSATSVRMNRSIYSNPPSGGFYLKNPFSVSHAISALALLNRAFR